MRREQPGDRQDLEVGQPARLPGRLGRPHESRQQLRCGQTEGEQRGQEEPTDPNPERNGCVAMRAGEEGEREQRQPVPGIEARLVPSGDDRHTGRHSDRGPPQPARRRDADEREPGEREPGAGFEEGRNVERGHGERRGEGDRPGDAAGARRPEGAAEREGG